MRTTIACIVMITFAASLGAVETDRLMLSDLEGSVFQTISASATNLVVQFMASGARYVYSLDNGYQKLSEYEEKIVLPIGVELNLYTRGKVISFSDLPQTVQCGGFHVRLVEDHRSGGKGLVKKEGYLLILGHDSFGSRLDILEPSSPDIALTDASVEAANALLEKALEHEGN